MLFELGFMIFKWYQTIWHFPYLMMSLIQPTVHKHIIFFVLYVVWCVGYGRKHAEHKLGTGTELWSGSGAVPHTDTVTRATVDSSPASPQHHITTTPQHHNTTTPQHWHSTLRVPAVAVLAWTSSMSLAALEDVDEDLPDILPGEVVHNDNGDLSFKVISQVQHSLLNVCSFV